MTVQRTPVYADVNVQNGGTRALGRWGGFARAQLIGLSGLADRTTIAVVPATAGEAAVEACAFFDWARVSSIDASLVEGSRHLESAGIGARAA